MNLIALKVFSFIVVIKTKNLVKNFKLPPFLHTCHYKIKLLSYLPSSMPIMKYITLYFF